MPEMDLAIKVSSDTKAQLADVAKSLAGVSTLLKSLLTSKGNESSDAIKKLGDAAKDTSTKTDAAANSEKKLADAAKDAGDKHKKAATDVDSLGNSLNKIKDSSGVLASSLKSLAASFLALEVVKQAKDFAELAAQSARLKEGLDAVAEASGVSAEEMNKIDKSVQALGYTAESSRQFLLRYTQAHLDLSKAQQVATLAQNLSIAAGRSSAEVLQQLTFAMQTGRAMALIHLGLTVDTAKAYRDYAKTLGESAGSLSQHQRALAVTNAVLAEGSKYNGLYADASKTAAGQMISLKIQVEQLKDSLGESLQPAFIAIMSTITGLVGELKDASDGMEEGDSTAEQLGAAIKSMGDTLVAGVHFLREHKDAIMDVVTAYIALKAALAIGEMSTAFAKTTALTTAMYNLGKGIGVVTGVVKTFVGGLTLVTTALFSLVALFANAALGENKLAEASRSLMAGALVPIVEVIQDISMAAYAAGKSLEYMWFKATGQTDKANSSLNEMKSRLSEMSQWSTNMAKESGAEWSKAFSGKIAETTGVSRMALNSGSSKLAAAKLREAEAQELQKDQEATDVLLGKGTDIAGEGFRSAKSIEMMGALQNVSSANGPMPLDKSGMAMALQNAAKSVQSPADLKAFKDAIQDLKTVKGYSSSVLGDERLALAVASDNVRKASQSFGKDLNEQAKASAKAKSQIAVDAAEQEGALRKIAAKQEEDDLKDAYSKGEVSLEDYYQKRADILNKGLDAELALSKAKVTQLMVERRFAMTQPERQDATNKITEEQNKRDQQVAQHGVDIANLELEAGKDQLAVQQELLSVQNSYEKSVGGLSGTLSEIDKKYDDMLKKTHGAGTDIINAAREQEKFKATLDDTVASYTALNAQAKAAGDYQKAVISYAASKGTITSGEQQSLENRLIRTEQAEVQKQVSQTQSQIASFESQIATVKAGNPDMDVSAYEDKIGELKTKLLDLNTQAVTLGASIKGYGDSLRESFTSSMSQGISSMLTDMGHAQNVLESMGKGLQKNAADMFAKNISEKMTTSLSSWTSTPGKEGSSVFDRMGKVLGFGNDKKALGATPSDPMHVSVVNFEALSTAAHGISSASLNGSTGLSGSFTPSSIAGMATSAAGSYGGSGLSALAGVAAQAIPALNGWSKLNSVKNMASQGSQNVGIQSPELGEAGMLSSVSAAPESSVNYGTAMETKDISRSSSGAGMSFLSHLSPMTVSSFAKDFTKAPSSSVQSIAQTSSLAAPTGGMVGGDGGGVGVGGTQKVMLSMDPTLLRRTFGDVMSEWGANAYAQR